MSAFPDDPTLIARGKYSTLRAEREDQYKRVQKICTTMQNHLTLAILGIQERPTKNRISLDTIRACLGNFENAWNRVDELVEEMEALKPEAWGEEDE